MRDDYRPARIGIALLGAGGVFGVALGVCSIVALRHYDAALPAFLQAAAQNHTHVSNRHMLRYEFLDGLVCAGGTGLIAAVLAAFLSWRPLGWARIAAAVVGVGAWIWTLAAITLNITEALPSVDNWTPEITRTQQNLLVTWYEPTVAVLGAGLLGCVTAGAAMLLFSTRADAWFHSRDPLAEPDPAWAAFVQKRHTEVVAR